MMNIAFVLKIRYDRNRKEDIMEDLKKLRDEIDLIDQKMAKLFEERLQVVSRIAQIKKEKGLPVQDPFRENEVIKKNKEFIEEERFQVYYHDFMEMMMEITKAFQYEVIEE